MPTTLAHRQDTARVVNLFADSLADVGRSLLSPVSAVMVAGGTALMWASSFFGFDAAAPAMDPTAKIALISSAIVGGLGLVSGSLIASYKSFQLARIEIEKNR